VSTVAIDKRTGELPYPDDPDVMDEVFLAGTEPTQTAEPPPPPADDAGVVDSGTPDVQ
jgi:penicillin-binding protein 1A